MRTTVARLLVLGAVLALAAAFQTGSSHAAGGLKIEPFVWQLSTDYPEGTPADNTLPIDTVYIKTHDATDWMSTYDSHPWAVSGPAAIQNLISVYAQQGIETAAWFVPKGTDYDTQVAMAEQVIDSGVTALYADLEPFQGFCYQDCAALATNFWARVRHDRPNARLGVIYDPRPWWWDASATTQWLANADVALPMCYWDDFVGQVPWGEAGGCITQAKADLHTLAPGHAIEYLPILQGDSTPDRVVQGMDAAIRADAQRVSLWRRGVVSGDAWITIAAYQQPGGPHCAEELVDGCLIREAMQPAVYMMQGGAKFPFYSSDIFNAMGLNSRDVQVVPFGEIRTLPDVPVDGTLLQEAASSTIYVVYGGARFVVPADELLQLGLDPANVRTIPIGTAAQIPIIPTDYARFRELSVQDQYVVLHGARIQLDATGESALAAAGHGGEALYVVPDGTLSQVPIAQVKRGDADCDGTVGTLDVVRVLQGAIGVPSPGLCVNISGDVSCDGHALASDALMVLRYLADDPMPPPPDCPPIGDPQPASLPLAVASPTPNETPGVASEPTVTTTPLATDAPTPMGTTTPSPSRSPSPPQSPSPSIAPSETPSASPTVTPLESPSPSAVP